MLIATGAVPRAAWAITPLKLGGALEGRVSDDSGKPQMGAVVQIFDRQDKLLERQLTGDTGSFVFAGLLPDVYSIRVTLATFLPAVRNQIHIQAGKSSLLEISLSGLFSSIRILPFSGHPDGIANDDWKWVLRSSSSTRPIFRYLPQDPPVVTAGATRAAIFTDSRGLVSLSAGGLNGDGTAGELGTAFAFATSLRGSSQVEFAGDVGYGVAADSPNTAVRATFSHAFGEVSPEVAVTMRQLYLPRAEIGEASGSLGSPLPPLRSISVNLGDRTQISESIELEYGVEFDTISFVDHLHYFSPYARLTYLPGGPDGPDYGTFHLTYTSGNARPELGLDNSLDPNLELPREVAALGALAPVTLRSGRARVQRGENYEVGYARKFGSREVRVSAYRESVQNGSLMLAGSDSGAFTGDVVPDLYTNSELFNAGNYHTMGYTAALTQNLGDHYQLTVTYGSVGVLAPRRDLDNIDSPDELRALIRPEQRNAVGVRASATLPRTGTRIIAGYQLMAAHAATAGHIYSTESDEVEPGLNLTVRQPIPAILGLPFRMEAAVDLHNLLAEGYLPISLSDGGMLLLVHTPRSLRGGVNFRF
jgi:hypothetical protein